ncbi:hypothetical protein CAEBREN_18974 [Caenorhabditis brenneri]|uniref:Uncharacterized protein n=1 Tax=Caenorhabditis brenneri TaxID=135651 RepID=G0M7R8_CAEBE|nr:hypothetical protein CAEBREN_18974 [Caenorhabditis brenneri]
MVSPKPMPEKEEPTNETNTKKIRKKKGFRGETVADRLIASAKRMQQLKLTEELNARKSSENDEEKQERVENKDEPVKLTKMEKLKKATHEIDDLSALEWETSSEQSGV